MKTEANYVMDSNVVKPVMTVICYMTYTKCCSRLG